MPCYNPNVYYMGDEERPWDKAKFLGPLRTIQNQKLTETEVMDGAKNGKFALLPCGRCKYCRKQTAAMWAARLELEAESYKDVIFVTMTYDDEHLKYGSFEYEPGKEVQAPTVNKEDAQKFIKRLRKELGKDKIKYFLAAEYGEKTQRPHYHAIIFGLTPKDAKFQKNQNGHKYFTSEWLTKKWGQGFVNFSSCEPGAYGYVSQYVNKKAIGKKEEIKKIKEGREPEFRLMSEGIGKKWLMEHLEEIQKTDDIILAGGRHTRPPRYYERLIDKKALEEKDVEQIFKAHSEELKAIKEKRREKAQRVMKARTSTLPYTDYLTICEKNDRFKAKRLREPES